MAVLQGLKRYFSDALWEEDSGGARGYLNRGLQIFILAARRLLQHRSWLKAASLAYSTILALIPLLALLFAILKSLGIQRLLAAQLMDRLAPGSHDFAMQILDYIEGTQVTSLGVFGVVFLLAALVLVMTNVERSFNETWQVPTTRPWMRKFSDYLSIFLLFPILMAVAISISSGILSQPDVRRLLSGILPAAFHSATSDLASLVLLWVAFTFIYLVMPNARVHFVSALVGGVVGGSLWQLAHYIFAWFQGVATYYNAIYGALYHLFFLVIWMFWSWLVVLFGVEAAYAHQNLDRLRQAWRRGEPTREPVDEYLALAALVAIAGRFAARRPLLTREELGRLFREGDSLAQRTVEVLKDCRLVLEASSEAHGPSGLIPALPLEQVTVKEVLHLLRESRGADLARNLADAPEITGMLKTLLAQAPPSPLDNQTLKDLVQLTPDEPASS